MTGSARHEQPQPIRVRLFVACVVAAAAVVTATLIPAYTPSMDQPSWLLSVVFVVLIAGCERLLVRYYHHGTVEALAPIEGAIAPLVFCASGLRAVGIVGVGVLLGQVINRNQPIKALFNVASWVLATGIGCLVWHGLSLPHTGGVESIAGLVLALTAIIAVNQVLIIGVLWCATGHAFGADTRGATVATGRIINLGFNTVIGILMVAAYLWQPWLVVVGAAPLIMLHIAGRAEASVRANQMRLLALQRATHHLAVSVDPESLRPFLTEVRDGFEVNEIQLVLLGDGASLPTVYTSSASGGWSVQSRRHPLAEELTTLHVPSIVDTEHWLDEDMADTAPSQVLAAPLHANQRTLGVLLLFSGAERDDSRSGDRAVAGALARELVSFIERVDLVRRIEEERRKLADIVDHTSDGIVSIDASGVVLSWNAGMAAMTGYTAEEMVGTRHLGLLRPRDAHGNDLHIVDWTQRWDSNQLSAEMQLVTATGNSLWVSTSYSRVPIGEGGQDVLIGVMRNITQARELELLKDDFVAVVSHELRTPLVPIKGWAQTLLNRGERLTEDQRRTAVQSILSQAQRLESLVLNILESSRVEAGHAESLEVVDLSAVAVNVVEDTLAARPDRTIRVRPPAVPCHVRGSAVWVERAITNLIGNALKYSPDDEPVDVVIGANRGNVTVAVTDRGPGIPPDAQDRIFQRFERLEQSRKQTGTGLGLYITRRLARGMGGDVTVSSMPGAGSTFVLSLPAAVTVTPGSDLPQPSEVVDVRRV